MPFAMTNIGSIHLFNIFAPQALIATVAVPSGSDGKNTSWPTSASSSDRSKEPHHTLDVSGFLSAFDSPPWPTTAGALVIDNIGVHLHGSNASAVKYLLPSYVSPALARTHPFVPLLPLKLADLLLNSATNLTLADPGLTVTPHQPSASFCARAFAGLALLSLVKVTEPFIDGNPAGSQITAETVLQLTKAYSDLALDLEFVAAQQLATVAYRNSKEHAVFYFDGADVPWSDDRAMSVAGFVYLAVRSVSSLTLGFLSEV